MNDSKRLSLQEWRELRKPVADVLPSGLQVMLQKVSVTSIALSGHMPMTLLAEASDKAGENGQAGQMELDTADILKNIDEYIGMVNAVTQAAVVEPPVADEPDDEHLGIDELDLDDKMYVLSWALQEVDALKPFREETT